MTIVAVVGLGYVGLPVALAFSQHYKVIAYDKRKSRVAALAAGYDDTQEVIVPKDCSNIIFTDNKEDIKEANFYIIAVPTPIDSAHKPDLTTLIQATKEVGSVLIKNDIVVFESTVYPSTTEDICIPLLEKGSKLKEGIDFSVGFSPERINPGDKNKNFNNINKLVAATSEHTAKKIANIYQQVISAKIIITPNIKVAEMAKIIENTQRDINIALMNEMAKICHLLDIDTQDVINAASSKWNFVPMQPGLVGGHCIGVDPYYITYKAKQLGFRPELILAGRRINDTMSEYVASQIIKQLINNKINISSAKIGIFGITYKENCKDLRSSKVPDLIFHLTSYGVTTVAHDPVACSTEACEEYQLNLHSWNTIDKLDAAVFCVAHKFYQELTYKEIISKLNDNYMVFDLKSAVSIALKRENNLKIWSL